MVDASQVQCWASTGRPSAGSMLIVEDDEQLMQYLARAMEARGFKVMIAGSVREALAQIQLSAPEYSVVDLRLDDGCGLDVVSALKQQRPNARAIILTGYGNIATAVKAVKLGAVDYLTKPVDADDIISALLVPLDGKAEAPQHPRSPDDVRLQHIQQVHEASGRNVSETARRLNMHRRTLQRILTRRTINELRLAVQPLAGEERGRAKAASK
jgi:two-component system, response regulator RegA